MSNRGCHHFWGFFGIWAGAGIRTGSGISERPVYPGVGRSGMGPGHSGVSFPVVEWAGRIGGASGSPGGRPGLRAASGAGRLGGCGDITIYRSPASVFAVSAPL